MEALQNNLKETELGKRDYEMTLDELLEKKKKETIAEIKATEICIFNLMNDLQRKNNELQKICLALQIKDLRGE